MGYTDHTESTESNDSLRQNYVQRYVTSMRRHYLAVVNSVGYTLATNFTRTWMDATAGFDLRMLWYLFCFVIYSIRISLF